MRDALLGLDPKDYDVATEARPDQVKQLFGRCRYVGEAFGVVLVPMRPWFIEVATFRSEWAYVDGRRPGRIAFSDAQHDAARRDFTINGLFEDPLAPEPSKRIIDLVGGQQDLAVGLVRAIGDPDERFAEDYLRMLRAVRFASRFDFELEPRTLAAIRSHAGQLGCISRPRIGQEVMAMLDPAAEVRPVLAVRLIQQTLLDGPALQQAHSNAVPATVEALGAAAHYPTVLAGWMLDRRPDAPASATELAGTLRQALSLSNAHHGALLGVLDLFAQALVWDRMPVARRKRLVARPSWAQALQLVAAWPHAPRQLADRIEIQCAALQRQGVAPPPLLSGHDLIQMGLTPGPRFAQLLEAAYDAQLEGHLRSRAEALNWMRQHI